MSAFREGTLTVFGLGRLRPASGTWGSVFVPGVVFVVLTAGVGGRLIDAILLGLAVAFGVACVVFGSWAEDRYGSDPSRVVADEVAGQALALLLLPWREEDWRWNAILLATGFLAFRLFDIVKVPPARQAERLPHGWGILVDDLVAGLYAMIVVQLVARVWVPDSAWLLG